MSLDLRNTKPVTYRSFADGLNEYYSDYVMKDSELRSCKNVEFRKPGRVDIRRGVGPYADLNATMIYPIKNMLYYTRRDGSHSVLAMACAATNGRLHADDDAGAFTQNTYVYAGDTGTDGRTRMVQYRDAVFIGDNAYNLKAYNPDIPLSGDVWAADEITGKVGANTGPATTLAVATGAKGSPGGLPDKVFYYRFTYQMYAGETFLGETHPIFDGYTERTGGSGQITNPIDQSKAVTNRDDGWETVDKGYDEFEVDLTASTTQSNKVDFQIQQPNFDTYLDGDLYKYVNVYRSGPYDAPRVGGPGYLYPEDNPANTASDGRFYLVGVIDVGAMNTQANGTVAFTDDKFESLGKQIEYRPSQLPPKPRFLEVHKDRLVLAAVDEYTGLTTGTRSQYNRIYFSEANQPMVFPKWSWIDIAPRDGEAITGIMSYRDKVLLAFKQTSMWAITGGDDVVFGNVPSFSRELIDQNIGCVAPETITYAEGLVLWLSHRGPYAYDGTIPTPLKDRHVQDTLRRIPDGRLYEAVAGYNALEREWWLAVSDGDVDASHNTVVLRYHFETGAWSKSVFPRGIASILEKENSQLKPQFLLGMDNAAMATVGSISRADLNPDDLHQTSISDYIQWQMDTKKLDFGEPYVDKRLIAIQIDGSSATQVGVLVKCDERLTTTVLDGFTTPGALIGKEVVMMDSRIWGRRFSITLYGTVQTGGTTPYIEGITCYWQPIEGVRQGA